MLQHTFDRPGEARCVATRSWTANLDGHLPANDARNALYDRVGFADTTTFFYLYNVGVALLPASCLANRLGTRLWDHRAYAVAAGFCFRFRNHFADAIITRFCPLFTHHFTGGVADLLGPFLRDDFELVASHVCVCLGLRERRVCVSDSDSWAIVHPA